MCQKVLNDYYHYYFQNIHFRFYEYEIIYIINSFFVCFKPLLKHHKDLWQCSILHFYILV